MLTTQHSAHPGLTCSTLPPRREGQDHQPTNKRTPGLKGLGTLLALGLVWDWWSRTAGTRALRPGAPQPEAHVGSPTSHARAAEYWGLGTSRSLGGICYKVSSALIVGGKNNSPQSAQECFCCVWAGPQAAVGARPGGEAICCVGVTRVKNPIQPQTHQAGPSWEMRGPCPPLMGHLHDQIWSRGLGSAPGAAPGGPRA